MRIVVDTNVLVSALLSKHSLPRRIFNLQQSGRFRIVISEAILSEYRRVLAYPDIQARHRFSQQGIEKYLSLLRNASVVVTPSEQVTVVKDDPDDNKFITCALAGNAEYLVSGDSDLLQIKTYQGIRILTPAAFLTFLDHEQQAA
jgi:putative PIN family toxin of toxin-antitoxin system